MKSFQLALYVGICCLVVNSAFGQKVKLLFTGELLMHDAQIQAGFNENTGGYDFDACFKWLKPLVQEADFTVTSLGTTFAGPPYNGDGKSSAPDALAVSMANVGFDLVLTANSYALDRGKQGLLRTIQQIKSNGMQPLGTHADWMDKTNNYPKMMSVKGLSIVWLTTTFSVNNYEPESIKLINVIDTAEIAADIDKAIRLDPDLIIMCPSWGIAFERLPSNDQKLLTKWFLEQGVDIVIGTHTNTVQPIELRYMDLDDGDSVEVVAAYSLGNLLSDQRKIHSDGGVALMIDVEKDFFTGTSIRNVEYIPLWVNKTNEEVPKFEVIPDPAAFSRGLDLSHLDEVAMRTFNGFISNTKEHLGQYNKDVSFRNFGGQMSMTSSAGAQVEQASVQTQNNSINEDLLNVPSVRKTYRIQVLASGDKNNAWQIPKFWHNQLVIEEAQDGLYKYMIGQYVDINIARSFKDQLKKEGLTGAFIVAYEQGKRVSIN